MDRYKATKIETNDDNNRVYATTIYSAIKMTENDKYIISKLGDRFDLYAKKYYDGQISMWPIIAHANQLGKGTLMVPPGVQIRIPILPSFDFHLEDLQNI